MNKGVIGLIIAIIIIVVAVAGFVVYRSSNTNIDNNIIKEEARIEENTVSGDSTENKNIANSGSNILVVYYSAQNHTKSVAEKIAKNLNADIFEIVPEDVYTSDDLNWTNSNSRVSREHNDESLRDVKLKNTKVNNWEDYDTVLIGYPIWWGIAAWPVDTFVKGNDFTGKTVIPFCTSASSGIGDSGTRLQKLAGTGNWQAGQRFSSGASASEVSKWVKSLKLGN